MGDITVAPIPDGFEPTDWALGFTRHLGGLYLHRDKPILAALIRAEHLNPVGIAHGGFLASLADCAFGVAFKHYLDTAIPPVTVNLNVDYLGAVREGQWVEAHVEIHKVGRSIANAGVQLRVGEKVVLRASGIFTVWKGEVPQA